MLVKGNEILPCWNAEPIGRLGDLPEDIHKKARWLDLKEQKKRGCVHCEIKSKCSKCLFTSPFSVDEYCHLRRRYLKVSNIF
jgi:radical SAM protein with 4Fe4S-binding SPASM domain